MDYQRYLDWTYFGKGGLDAEEFDRIAELFTDVDVFIDVGASHGVYVFHAIRHMNGGRIVAIEADPERFEVLQRNVAEWTDAHPDEPAEPTDTPEVVCLLAAASDAEDLAQGDHVTFYTTGTQISGGLFPVPERSDEYEPIEIPLVRLDDLVEPDEFALVKIDVEGGELRVLRGAERLIQTGMARFFVELSWWGDRERGTSVLSTLRFARGAGLSIERRLRSDYLLTPEPDDRRRTRSTVRVLPALLPRYVFATLVPERWRTSYIRRQNAKRIAAAPVEA